LVQPEAQSLMLDWVVGGDLMIKKSLVSLVWGLQTSAWGTRSAGFLWCTRTAHRRYSLTPCPALHDWNGALLQLTGARFESASLVLARGPGWLCCERSWGARRVHALLDEHSCCCKHEGLCTTCKAKRRCTDVFTLTFTHMHFPHRIACVLSVSRWA